MQFAESQRGSGLSLSQTHSLGHNTMKLGIHIAENTSVRQNVFKYTVVSEATVDRFDVVFSGGAYTSEVAEMCRGVQ